ncbi:hypothetical protein COV88_00195 [Candidatus Saccharibacteria bacterium CG11_big_fil_rev_8_21_14_0_20_41_19]|nr:hypothetical protein [Candidatus Saccharibacteria bacterium]OIP85424.1 MAG: hypothetical protein AUK57_03865 [Candidatus Saccharibacteria bacterium CG2_30_41_52]PIQ71203.1 MAG: hypothetical protein COV88_00195 [Candidatus Saccharibacteria bacterium CG11_big_fil_rev_8_21_14_0_20_41_19]PIZ59850.1 MAG: hypothetical protein COY18_02680 [Candidatus Saccharibacteria bacterium CG_4_10_14_0_2_um_filter_41_11]PJC29950.1 MAG: hypothetical protein CO052_00590 [Candidatus Saccharibacteria bacterium CG_4
MRPRANRSIRNILISAVVLLVLFVGAGIGYTWYMGQNTSPGTASVVENKSTEPVVVKQTLPAANTPESASVQSLVSPVLSGSNSTITVRTKADSICKISVIYDKTASTDSGLYNKTADEYGMVSWSWKIEDSVPLGKWPVSVTCTHNKKSAVVVGDLKVVSQIEL